MMTPKWQCRKGNIMWMPRGDWSCSLVNVVKVTEKLGDYFFYNHYNSSNCCTFAIDDNDINHRIVDSATGHDARVGICLSDEGRDV